MTNWLFYVAIYTLVMIGIGYLIGWAMYAPILGDAKVVAVENGYPDTPKDEVVEEEIVGEAFVVAGRPRKKAWKQRRRELEATARTKRHKLEEWSD